MIEDIDFLGDNSEVDSTLFFLDSDSRDRVAFPTPAEYVIDFSESIKLVTGVDILDATIPAAMFIVDFNSDSFSVTTLSSPSDPDGISAQALLSAVLTRNNLIAAAMTSNTVNALYCELVDYDAADTRVQLWQPLADNLPNVQFILIVRQTWDAYVFESAAALTAATHASPLLTFRKAVITLQHGNYDVVSLMSQLSLSLQTVGTPSPGAPQFSPMDQTFKLFNVVSSSSATVALQGRYAFTNKATPFVLDMHHTFSTARSTIGFDTLPIPNDGLGYRCDPAMSGSFGSVSSSSVSIATLSNTAFSTATTNIVVAPGIANLLGVRYITLRCPEIEQHLFSAMTYGSHSTGIGVFKLPSGSNEVANLRFDFVSLIRKPFHPIGKLARLTLRFEISEGVLYDFKGINTQLLLAVRFLSPGKRVALKKSVLNPDYDPDFLRYTMRGLPSLSGLTSLIPPSGLLPEAAPYLDRDDLDSNVVDKVPVTNDVNRRREIAQRLLNEQDKYDYPAAEGDSTSSRSVF